MNAAKHAVPDPARIQRALSTLFERTVSVTVANVTRHHGLSVKAAYVFDSGHVAGVLACDLPLAATLSAALAVLPPTVVRAAIKAGALDEALAANFHEIANILTGALASVFERRVSLRDVVTGPRQILAIDAEELVAHPAQRIDLDVGVSGYGAGCLAFAVCSTYDAAEWARRARG